MDIEKAFDGVLGKMMEGAMRKKGWKEPLGTIENCMSCDESLSRNSDES